MRHAHYDSEDANSAVCVCVCVCVGEKRDLLFSSMMHHWAIQSSSLFSNMVRHLIDRDDFFDDMVNKLIVRLDL